MSFHADGTLLGGRFRPNRPLGWVEEPGATLHHMIDWAALREFWNRLVRDRRQAAMERYVWIAGFEGDAAWIVGEVLNGRIYQVRDSDRMAYDSLAMALCWQCYNLFEGPPYEFRPAHSPDPGQYLLHFADLGANSFDFPIVVPPHGFRANTLYRAFLQMTEFNGGGGEGALRACLDLLESVADLDVIPPYDVNWFALPKAEFLGLTLIQRQQYFRGCRRFGWRPSEEQVRAAFAAATAL
jgi:hypothetical protein